jgi:hypothetical protein
MLRGMIAGRAGIVGAVAYLAIGETVIPGFKLSDHMSKDQSCAVYPPPKGCPGNLAGKSNQATGIFKQGH